MSSHAIIKALRALRDAALEELPVAREDGNELIVHSFARICDTAAENMEIHERALALQGQV